MSKSSSDPLHRKVMFRPGVQITYPGQIPTNAIKGAIIAPKNTHTEDQPAISSAAAASSLSTSSTDAFEVAEQIMGTPLCKVTREDRHALLKGPTIDVSLYKENQLPKVWKNVPQAMLKYFSGYARKKLTNPDVQHLKLEVGAEAAVTLLLNYFEKNCQTKGTFRITFPENFKEAIILFLTAGGLEATEVKHRLWLAIAKRLDRFDFALDELELIITHFERETKIFRHTIHRVAEMKWDGTGLAEEENSFSEFMKFYPAFSDAIDNINANRQLKLDRYRNDKHAERLRGGMGMPSSRPNRKSQNKTQPVISVHPASPLLKTAESSTFVTKKPPSSIVSGIGNYSPIGTEAFPIFAMVDEQGRILPPVDDEGTAEWERAIAESLAMSEARDEWRRRDAAEQRTKRAKQRAEAIESARDPVMDGCVVQRGFNVKGNDGAKVTAGFEVNWAFNRKKKSK